MISIIVPVFNTAKYFSECIESILAQTYEDFEVLLIDDGSTDNSGHLCDIYAEKDARVRVFHKRNAGVSRARNDGLDQAKGEWVIFVDSDDWLQSDYLEAFMKTKKLTRETLLFQGFKRSLDGVITKTISFIPDISETAGLSQIIQNDLLTRWESCGKLYNLDVIRKLKLKFEPRFSLGEDAVFFYKYLSGVSRLSALENSGYIYRDTQSSLSKKSFSWEIRYLGGRAIDKAASPVVQKFITGNFRYKKKMLNMLTFEQQLFNLEALYTREYSHKQRLSALNLMFGNRLKLLSLFYPLFSKKRKCSLLWSLFLFSPHWLADKLLRKIFSK
jgi:glycosyltransferase involved in cell wall biosynthesis